MAVVVAGLAAPARKMVFGVRCLLVAFAHKPADAVVFPVPCGALGTVRAQTGCRADAFARWQIFEFVVSFSEV
jgi:hypothetical protein